MTPRGLENSVPHLLYDLSVPLEQRKPLEFKSAHAVARYLSVPATSVHRYRGRRIRSRDGKIYALRIKPTR